MKANDRLAVLRLFGREDAGADVVSEGELRRAREAGIPASRIVFSGVGKGERELRLALAEDIEQINVESAEELDMLSAIAATMNRTARVALRINPDVDAGTHAKITTGLAHNKFGVPYPDAVALYARAASLPGIEPVGLAVHIGSQIRISGTLPRSLRPHRRYGPHAARRGSSGHHGGLRRRPRHPLPQRACAQPGRSGRCNPQRIPQCGREADAGTRPLARGATAGLLLSSVILEKQAPGGRFVVLDAAMNDLVRPAMYDAWHGIVPVSAVDAVAPTTPADVVGPICESGDTFARNRLLPSLAPNARVAILDAGAYGSVMSSAYNARPPAAEVMVDGAEWSVIRDRPALTDLWHGEHVPHWLE